MWSRKPTPVSRSPAPSPSSSRATRTSVSPVVRLISALRVTYAIVANARLHRFGVHFEPLCTGDRGGEPGQLPGALVNPDLGEAAAKVCRRQSRGEAGRASGGQNVIGAGDV